MGTVNLGDRWLALRFTPKELRLLAQGWSLRPTLGLNMGVVADWWFTNVNALAREGVGM